MNIHILGICGTLMGSIALLARELGHRVTGTDQNVYPPMSTQLEEAGISLTSPYTADCIPGDAELIIVGNAGLPRGNPAVEAMLDGNVPYTSGAEWMSRYLLGDRWVIAVAGTHGKTTTTSMIAWILEYAGLKPGFLIGGVPLNLGVSSRLGESPFFVVEADEYDTSYFDRRSKFLHYRPRTLVLNNLEYDHADIFENLEQIKAQFHLLMRTVPGTGLTIYPQSDENISDVLGRGCWSQTLSLGGDELGYKVDESTPSRFHVLMRGKVVGTIDWELSGEHNRQNAIAAIAAARHVGVTPGIACEALCRFRNVKRRMEQIFTGPTISGSTVTLYDDFAHHPTAIATTLNGLRAKYPRDRILAIIEPASHTMKKGTHATTLAQSTSGADHVVWFKPAKVSWDMSLLRNGHTQVLDNTGEIIEAALSAVNKTKTNLHIVIMSNSSFGGLHKTMVERLNRLA